MSMASLVVRLANSKRTVNFLRPIILLFTSLYLPYRYCLVQSVHLRQQAIKQKKQTALGTQAWFLVVMNGSLLVSHSCNQREMR